MRLAVALLLSLICVQAFAAESSWTGTWDTRWRNGGARVELKQDGAKVTGTYASYDGVIEGQIEGRVLKGRWIQGSRSGGIKFVMAPDGRSFMGRYATGEWWTGGRAAADLESLRVDQRGPRQALRTFVDAGNAARYDAPDEMTRAVAVLDFGDKGAALPPEQKLAKAQTLFDMVDQTTFRLFDLPDAAAKGDAVSITLQQAGTSASLPLRLDKKGDRWFIAMPDDAALAAAGKALLARSGGRLPSPEAYKLRHNARDAWRTFTRSFFTWDTGGRAQGLASLDLSDLPEAVRGYQGELSAEYLNGILNRVGLVQPQEISDDPKNTEPFIVFSHPAGRVVIAPNGTGDAATWKFTADTVREARDLYVLVEDMPAVGGEKLPAPASLFFDIRRGVRGVAPVMLAQLGTLELWQIAGWAAVILIALAVGYGLARIVLAVLIRLVGGDDPQAERRAFRWPLWGVLAFSLYKLMIPAIGLPELATRFSVGATGVLLALSMMWLVWILIDAIAARYFSTSDGKRVTMDNIIVSLGFGFLKLVLVAVGLTYIAMELSLPYEGIVASLSIGGLAVAFASRETLSNVFGAGVLAIDRPFRRGDYIAAGDTKGTVEHVGIRSTRVRTPDDSLIIVPNGKLSDAIVNNLGTRRYHLNSAKLPLPYSTSVPQLEALISGVRDLVAAIPQAAQDRTSVAVSSLGPEGIELMLAYGLDANRGGNETEIVNRLMLNILKLCERLGIRASREELPRPT